MQAGNPVAYHEAWQQLCSSNGVLIPGGFGTRGLEGKMLAIQWARKNKMPFLGEYNYLSFLFSTLNCFHGIFHSL